MVAVPLCEPVKRSMAFCCCVGPAPGVIDPDGPVRAIVVAADKEIVAKPPIMPSMATKLGFMAAVPHDPVRSPVFGMISALLTVFGSAIDLSVLPGITASPGDKRASQNVTPFHEPPRV